MNVRDLDPYQVGYGNFWSDLDPSRSYSSLQFYLSALQSTWNPKYSKSDGSKIPDFKSMDAHLLNKNIKTVDF
jgi:hypothetical protein